MKFTSKDTHTPFYQCGSPGQAYVWLHLCVCVCEISSLVWDTNRPPSSLRGFLLCLFKVMDEQITERERGSKRSPSFWLWWVPRIGNVSLTYYTTIVTKDLLSSGLFFTFLVSVQIKLKIKLISKLLVKINAIVRGPVNNITWSSSESDRALECSMFYSWLVLSKNIKLTFVTLTQPHAYIF